MTRKNKRTANTVSARRPIADRLIRKLRGYVEAKVVDLSAVREGNKTAEALQKTVASGEELADYQPAHAAYVYAQNQASVLVEQLVMLPGMERFVRIIDNAQEQYVPNGPPMSPLTSSFFTNWSMFDVAIGLGRETLGTIAMAVGKAFGMHHDLLRMIGLMQDSRMAVYVHEGFDDDKILLRELVTNQRCKAICPTGYRGRSGQLWYARVLPPPFTEMDVHVVFTTPYVLVTPDERGWQAYFDRTLPQQTPEKRLAAYEKHMKWGPARDYWTEFVFEAYVNHRHDVIFLSGLPDVPESRPHSRVNS